MARNRPMRSAHVLLPRLLLAVLALLLLAIRHTRATCDLPDDVPKRPGFEEDFEDVMQRACKWTGNADCDVSGCSDRCLANLFPALIASPEISGIGYLHDAFYKICPELTLAITRVATGAFLNGPDAQNITNADLECPTDSVIDSLESKMGNIAAEMRKAMDGEPSDLHWSYQYSCASVPHLYSRMQAFLASSDDAKAYINEHCSSEVLDTSIPPWDGLWSVRWSQAEEPGRVNACVNVSYVEEYRARLTEGLAGDGNLFDPEAVKRCTHSAFDQPANDTCYTLRDFFAPTAEECVGPRTLPFFAQASAVRDIVGASEQLEQQCSRIATQGACESARAPEALRTIERAGSASRMADPSAARLPVEAQDHYISTCLRSKPVQPDTRALQQPHTVFTNLELSPWRRIYISEDADNALVAVCTLIVTVAIGAIIVRLVRLRRGRELTQSALRRELAYSSTFVIIGARLKPLLARCRRGAKRGADGSSEQRSFRRTLLLVAFPAAIVWVACEVAFIFLVLPTTIDVHFPHALQHAVVPSLTGHNLGPLTSEGCRTLRWSVHGGLELEQALVMRRCYTTAISLADASVDADAPPNSSVTLEYSDVDGKLLLRMPATSPTSFNREAEFTTHVYRSESPGGGGAGNVAVDSASSLSLPLSGAFDFGQLEPLFIKALQDDEGACQIVAGSGTVCPSDRFGDATTWQLECNDENARKPAMTRLTMQLALHVDLRIAAVQTEDGFAGGLELGVLRAAAGQEQGIADERQKRRSLVDTMRGDSNVVARVKAARINLAAALILAAIAAVVYQLTQLSDHASAAVALHCVSAHSAAKPRDSHSCPGRAGAEGPSADQLEAQAVAADDARAAQNNVALPPPPPAAPPTLPMLSQRSSDSEMPMSNTLNLTHV